MLTDPPPRPALLERQSRGLLFEGDGVERLHSLIIEHFAEHGFQVLGRQPLGGRFSCLVRGPVSVYELGYGVEVRVDPGVLPDFYNVHIPLAGGGTVTVDRHTLPSPLSIAGPGQRLSMRWNADSLTRIVVITREALDQAFAARTHVPPDRPIRFAPVLDHGDTQVRAWLSVVESYAQAAQAGMLDRSPLAREHFEQVLIHGLLDIQSHTHTTAMSAIGPAVSSRVVRQAMAFCDEHAHQPITVTDMAQAAGVGVRGLRAGFRAHLGTTPLAYLRQVRLAQAHHELTSHDHATTVTEVALRWGFPHLGRFAQLYRQTYGQTPSSTLNGRSSRTA